MVADHAAPADAAAKQDRADALWYKATALDNAAESAQTVVDNERLAKIMAGGVATVQYSVGATTLNISAVGPITVQGLGGDWGLVAGELDKLPTLILGTLAAEKVKFVAVQNAVTDYAPQLASDPLRNREGTWSTTPGAYLSSLNVVVIGTSGLYNNGQGSYDLVLHETGHAYDWALGQKIGARGGLASNTSYFITAHQGTVGTYDLTNPWENYHSAINAPVDPVRSATRSEAYPESFADTYGGDPSTINQSIFTHPDNPVLITPARQSLSTYWVSHWNGR